MILKVPNFLRDNPMESLLAAALLFGLLFISADGTQPQPSGAVFTVAQKN